MDDLLDLMLEPKEAPQSERFVEGFILRSGIPVGTDGRERKLREFERPHFPFAKMLVGECFDQRPIEGLSLIETQNLVSGAACQHRKKVPPGSWNFATRQIGGRFVRCWRIL